MRLGYQAQVPNMAETDRRYDTICTWWTKIEVLIVTGVTNLRTRAANTTIKNAKRTFRNAHNYRTRILPAGAARSAT